MTVSKHANKRIKGRMGINMKSGDRQLSLAIERGIHHGQMKGNLRKWADSFALRDEKKKYVVTYNAHLFLIDKSSKTLITMIPVPSNIMKNIHKMVDNTKTVNF